MSFVRAVDAFREPARLPAAKAGSGGWTFGPPTPERWLAQRVFGRERDGAPSPHSMPRRQLTHSITLGDIPVVTINAHEYREFRLEPETRRTTAPADAQPVVV